MIKINDQILELNKFPDGTFLLKDDSYNPHNIITWNFENNEELIALIFIAKHLRKNRSVVLDLVMPYIPNARQDRVKKREDVFTLKYFAEIINGLEFDSVTVLDPHSSVSEALLNDLIVDTPKKFIEKTVYTIFDDLGSKKLIAFYPDEGAMKRYSEMSPIPYAFGIKERDWNSGKILGLDVVGSKKEFIPNSDILIIDDISSRGGTFYHSAKKLKELGANNIYLYITHCEETIFDGEIFKSGLVQKVFTTDSIFGAKAQLKAKELGIEEKIEVFHYE